MEKKKSKKKVLIVVLIVICVLLVEFIIFMAVFGLSYNNTDEAVPAVNNVTDTITTLPETETETASDSTDATEQTEQTEETVKIEATEEPVDTIAPTESSQQSPQQPSDMVSALESAGYDVDDLSAEQLIVVRSQGNSATISMYQADDNGVWSDLGMTCYGFVGQNGVDIKSMEGDYKTPYGLFPIGDMFYIDTFPQTGLDYFRITSDTYWVDDPNSVYYNQRVEGTADMDWNSAEHMISYYSSYKYGFVIDYNVNPIVPGKGSAIFFHVGSSPTAGCVAVSESDMLSYLSVLDKNKNPYILII